MQFIPGVFYKPCSLILRCKSPQALAGLSVSQPLEQHSIQTGRHTDRKTENNASNCVRIECGRQATIWKRKLELKEEDSLERGCVGGADRQVWVRVLDCGRTGDGSAGWGLLSPPIIRSSAGKVRVL